jgi:hypothetical protein
MSCSGARYIKRDIPYIFDYAVYVRWGAFLFTPSTFPTKGRGVGPGGSGGLLVRAGERDGLGLSFRAPWMVSSTTTSARRATIIVEPKENVRRYSKLLVQFWRVFSHCWRVHIAVVNNGRKVVTGWDDSMTKVRWQEKKALPDCHRR